MKKTPGNLETASNLALILHSEGNMQEAIPILKHNPTKSDVPEILFNYAIALEKAGFLDKAESTYEKIIKLRKTLVQHITTQACLCKKRKYCASC